MPFKMSKNEVTLLGFQLAGWDDYRRKLQAQGFTVHTTTNPILSKKDSIYWGAHGAEELKRKSQTKTQDREKVSLVLQDILDLLSDLKDPITWANLYLYIQVEVLKLPADEAELTRMETSEDPANEVLNTLLDITSFLDPKELEGYALISLLREESILENCLVKSDSANLKPLRDKMAEINFDSKSEDIQLSLASSKVMLTDTLQHNLSLLKEKKPLIPIYFIISSEDFIPDWKKVTNKEGFFQTNAEMRMAYKLMNEVDDPLIHQVMRSTVFFYKNTGNELKQIPAPWLNNEDWAQRKRSDNKTAYKDRPKAQVPPWIQELKRLSQETARCITEIDYKKSSSFLSVTHVSVFQATDQLTPENIGNPIGELKN